VIGVFVRDENRVELFGIFADGGEARDDVTAA
jgi:hypothetical protein